MIRQLYGSRELRRWSLILYWIVMFVATHWPDIGRYIPEAGWPFRFFDSVVHTIIYTGWVWMWWWFLSADGRRVSRAAICWLLVGGALWAVFDELSQVIVAREPAVDDLLCDFSGMLLATLVLSLWRRSPFVARRP